MRPRRGSRPGPPDRGRVDLSALWRDPRYLEVKERLGESLTPAERAILEAGRPGPDPKPIGGGEP